MKYNRALTFVKVMILCKESQVELLNLHEILWLLCITANFA
jgi:hypothetical protein